MVLVGDPCFIYTKLFNFKKWTHDFKHFRENFKEVPIWVKFPNFSLYCCSENGITKIASKIGVPLTIDPLTTMSNVLPLLELVLKSMWILFSQILL